VILRKNMIAGVSTLILSGCVLVDQDLIDRNIARVETTPSSELVFESVSVTRQGVGIVVNGSLRHRHGRTAREIPGHVDVLVIDTDGAVIASGAVPYSVSHAGTSAWVEFGMQISVDDVSVVQLSHHVAEHKITHE